SCTVTVSVFFFSSRRRHTMSKRDWSSDVCSSDLGPARDSVAAGSVLVGESIEFAIPSRRRAIHGGARFSREFARNGRGGAGRPRSEGRRVGKESRYRGGRGGSRE